MLVRQLRGPSEHFPRGLLAATCLADGRARSSRKYIRRVRTHKKKKSVGRVVASLSRDNVCTLGDKAWVVRYGA